MEVDIKLDTFEKIQRFVSIVSKYDSQFDLSSGRYVVDAKSILGIMALDSSVIHKLTIIERSDEVIYSILLEIEPFIAR